MENELKEPNISERVQVTLPLCWYAVASTVVRNLKERESGSCLDVAGRLGGGFYTERSGQKGVQVYLIRAWDPHVEKMKTSDITLQVVQSYEDVLKRVARKWRNVATNEVLDLSNKGTTFISTLIGSLLAALPYDSANEVKLKKHGNVLLGDYTLELFDVFMYDVIQKDGEGRPYNMVLRLLKYKIKIEAGSVNVKRGRSTTRQLNVKDVPKVQTKQTVKHRPKLELSRDMER